MPQIELVILQATPFCNISCKYCYLPDRSSKARMTMDTVRRIFSSVFASGWAGDQLDVAWHAGEPLVVPVSFYREAFKQINLLCPMGVEIRHTFQTNGLLLNDEWCRLFKLTNSRIGVSIDGPQLLNDLNRITRTGVGTFEDILSGIKILRANKVNFYVISVLTRESLSKAKELYEFYQSEGIEEVCFNIEEIEGANGISSLQEPGLQSDFDRFLREFWNLNVKYGAIQYIREFNQMFRNIVRPAGTSTTNSLVEPFSIVSFDTEGNFSTFSPELLGNSSKEYPSFVLGNIWDVDLAQALKSSLMERLRADINAGVNACRNECEYFQICGGGAPVNKLYENGTMRSSETMYCRLCVKTVANVAMDIIDCSASGQVTTEESKAPHKNELMALRH
jgi:uncharacterized protein